MSQPNNSTNHVTKICNQCNREYLGYRTSRYCTKVCSKIATNITVNKKLLKLSLEKYPDGSDKNSYVECGVCGYRSSDLSSHPKIHNLTQKQYKAIYGDCIKCKDVIDAVSGVNNPGYKHNGKFSPYSKNFIHYKDDENIRTLIQKSSQTRSDNNNYNVRLSYYTTRGYSEDVALEMLTKRQTTFSKEICIEKYGEESGIQRWSERQRKWLSNFPKMNYSKISQKLFSEVHKNYVGDVYFATNDRIECKHKENKEYRLILTDGSYILPDFICLNNKKIIEFDGDYWHSEQVVNPSKEAERDRKIIEAGYDVLHIKEFLYKQDEDKTIQQCINFLTQ